MITNRIVEELELNYLDKRLAWHEAENAAGLAKREVELASEKFIAARRQFLKQKLECSDPPKLGDKGDGR
jgi:hypothetical protein